MKPVILSLMFASVALGACSGGSTTNNTTSQDSGVTPAVDVVTVTDTGAPPADTGPAPVVGENTYWGEPFATAVGQRFRPFALTACNRTGDEAAWRFDGPDFYTSQLTVISIAAGWCVPCQNESGQIQQEIIDHYAGQGVRFVQILVQNPDRTAISSSFCNTWATRYHLPTPELMDPTFVTQPYVPMTAFPGNVIVDRCGQIRWREYGTETGLTSIKRAIDDILANPRYPNCPPVE